MQPGKIPYLADNESYLMNYMLGASHHCSEPGTGKSPEPAGWKACATDRESSRLAAAMKAEGALAFVRVLGGRAAASRDGSRSGDSVKMRPYMRP